MNAESKWNDLLVLQKLKNKERGAVRDFIRDYQDKIFRICLGFLHNREDAEELTQDVFMEIVSNIGKFKGESKLDTWVYRICYTRALNRIRKDKWQKWMQSFDAVMGLDFSGEQNNDAAEDAFERKSSLLKAAMAKLPGSQKTAFVLHHYEGLKYQEIAEVMKTSVSSVESLIFRARKNLNKDLKNMIEN